MTQKNQPGYPLPDGVLGNDEIVCQLVYLPDRPEYWQALLGAISYMATWKAWERDSSKRGKDAAANWREAFELTMECWRMTCLEDLKQDVSDILVLMANRKDCCDDNVTYNIQIEIGTEIDPGVGDPPDFYGETAVTDWDDWLEHVCYNAHLYVDNLINMASQMEGAVAQSSIYIGLIAAALAVLSFSGIGLPVAYLLAAGVVAGLVLTATTSTFDTTAEDLEDARESIVCALLLGHSIADAVETALGSGAAWDLFYQFADYSSATAAIYEGGYNEDYLPADTRDDCSCTEGYEMVVFAGQGYMVDQTHHAPEFAAGCWQTSQIRVEVEGDPENWQPFKIISMEAITGPCSTFPIYRVWDYPSAVLIYSADTPPANLSNCMFISVKAAGNYGSKEILWTIES